MLSRSVPRNKGRDKQVGTIGKLHQSNGTLQTNRFRWTQNTGLQTLIFPGRVFCWTYRKFPNQLQAESHIGSTNICSNFLDVQETNSRVSQRCRIRNNFFGLWFENARYTSIAKVRWCFGNLFAFRCWGKPRRVEVGSFQVRLSICEDSEAVIRMIRKGRSPNLRHVSRIYRVDLDWLCQRSISTVPCPFDMCAPRKSWQTYLSTEGALTTIQRKSLTRSFDIHHLVLQFWSSPPLTRYLMSSTPSVTSKVGLGKKS